MQKSRKKLKSWLSETVDIITCMGILIIQGFHLISWLLLFDIMNLWIHNPSLTFSLRKAFFLLPYYLFTAVASCSYTVKHSRGSLRGWDRRENSWGERKLEDQMSPFYFVHVEHIHCGYSRVAHTRSDHNKLDGLLPEHHLQQEDFKYQVTISLIQSSCPLLSFQSFNTSSMG